MKPPEELLPKHYDELVSISSLQRDPIFNPRDYQPTERLIREIERKGMKTGVIVREDPSSEKLFIGDGNQRYKAAVDELGWTHVPCIIYSEDEISQYRSDVVSTSEQRGWTDFQIWKNEVKSFEFFYNEYKNGSLTREEALEKTLETGSAERIADIEKWIGIFQLPKAILYLLKEPKNRMGEKSVVNKLSVFSDVDTTRARLYIGVADVLAEYQDEVRRSRLLSVAAKTCGIRTQSLNKQRQGLESAKEFARKAMEEPFRDLNDIEDEVYRPTKSQSNDSDALKFANPSFNIGEQKIDELYHVCENADMTLHELVEEILRRVDCEKIMEQGKVQIAAD